MNYISVHNLNNKVFIYHHLLVYSIFFTILTILFNFIFIFFCKYMTGIPQSVYICQQF